ncbi:BrnA antitoxin family protein [Gilvimarinus xylanilyticus]|uniref:BrnA antitoxin family protein n=1 Tax=Gilvimarinus xylanilyticus TaxID=2944139 RepID=A0A9X2I7E6_9GAMM|nr:BrnA antitoxin family protein [Gilvimarinus xylanilyticus]MCP8900212.1 BrnA antitoxin family protein [Gilvimarinus xylanilyticus]
MSKSTDVTGPDAENPEWTDEMFARARRGTEAARRLGRPKSEKTKRSTTLRLDEDVIEFFKRDGKGWQTRLNNALREYVSEHR